jgi:SAM-dependent methyltransferase
LIGERIGIAVLQSLCRPVDSSDYEMKHVHYDEADSLADAAAVFSDFETAVRGADVLDFGSGYGYQTMAIAKLGAKSVTGVEINQELLAAAIARAASTEAGVRFSSTIDGSYDLIYSQNSFEHFLDPDQICSDLRAHLRPGGRIYITFAPPWLAPYGAHMRYFTHLPWVQLLFTESVVMAVRSNYRKDQAKTYTACGLGKMTIERFEQTIKRTGLQVEVCRYDCVRGMNFLAGVPMLRELFINRVSCVLKRA